MTAPDLKPCPFCGADKVAVCQSERANPVFWVECISCNAETQPSTNKAEAIAAWNTRATDPRIEEADRAIANLQREYDKRGDSIEVLEQSVVRLEREVRWWEEDSATRIEALERERERERLGREVNMARYGQPDFAWSIHKEAMADLQARLAKAVEALRVLIDHTHNCEKELTEDLHRADFCGESLPLTNARATLAEMGGEA